MPPPRVGTGWSIQGRNRSLAFSYEALADAVAGDLETGGNSTLRVTGTGQHADAARLRHGQQINDGNNREEQKGHLKDGRE